MDWNDLEQVAALKPIIATANRHEWRRYHALLVEAVAHVLGEDAYPQDSPPVDPEEYDLEEPAG